ncbi:protein cornichon, putative [Entamoeba invadens IP1]|uniref:protein cornichon, putative n=1 Tax=Entamoeba invadens IP1 TaxID=370355 RepID=UPI0002C3F200|nr:protein cornichon, putative [Entamoeba invadens IP1]ELP93978.1 protein cornichon, putative [Entamoeba invadens IP1]|eukprot:XP_004260749.1 protein cornichon, putative [Entamoeba invadens IP1]
MSNFTLISTWLSGIVLCGINLVIDLFHALCIVDLQSDELSPVDFCSRVNPVLFPEFLIHIVLTFLFIPHMNWLELFITVPVLVYDVISFLKHDHFYQPITVFNNIRMKEKISYSKLAYYLAFIFILLARLLYFVIVTYSTSKVSKRH